MKQSINITMQGQPSKIKKLSSHTEFIILLATVVLMLASYFVNNAFFSQYNMSTLLRQMSFVTIVAFGQTMILILGDIDLSVGATAGLSAITAAILMAWLGLPPQLTFVLCIVLGALCGLFNGFFVTKFRITPFIITLGSSYIFEGIIYVITEGRSITNIPASFLSLGQEMVGGVLPIPVLFMIIIGAVLYFVLKHTPFGRYLYAIGVNQTAAKLVGINVNRSRRTVYVLSGILSAFAGMLIMARLGTAQPTIGSTWVMPSITAVILGGTSMSGGRGGVIGTVIGSLMMSVISNAIVIMRVSTYMEQVVIGAVVIIAVLIDAIRTNMSTK